MPARITRSSLTPGRIAIFALAAGLIVRLPTLAFPLTEAQAFRQTQTAFPAVIYATEGVDLMHPKVPVFGPPWDVPFEFPLYQALASILIRLGATPEVALRSLSLVAFLGSAGLLWLLLSRHVSSRVALISLLVFLFSPFALLWSRTSMVEYPATFGALAFVLGVLEWQAGHGRRWVVLALIGGVGVALIKITTAAFWVLPALLTRRRWSVALVAISLLAGAAWTRWADAVKAASADTVWLTSSRLFDWNFGGDRLSIDTWLPILGPLLLTAGMLVAPIAILVIFRRERLIWAWFGVALVGPLVLFTNLHAQHDYYAAAITPALAALIGGGLDRLLQRSPRTTPVLIGAAAIMVLASVRTIPYWSSAYAAADPENVLGRAAIIRAASPDEQPVQLPCHDWSPAAMYYAGRRGYVLARDHRLAGDSRPAGYVVITDQSVCPPVP